MTQDEIKAVAAEVVRQLKPLLGIKQEWMSEADAARFLGVSPTTLRENRAILRPRILGKRWKYSKDMLEKALTNPWIKIGGPQC
jgi:hypothetical protein